MAASKPALLMTVLTSVFFASVPCASMSKAGNGHDVVPVDQRALFIAEQNAVGVAVVGDAQVGAMLPDLLAHERRDAWSRIPC